MSFLKEIRDLAIENYKNSKIFPSVVLAQAYLETGSGTSELAKYANNYFGIKGEYNGQSYLKDTWEHLNGADTTVNAGFRKYPSLKASVLDHGSFFTETPWRAQNYASVTSAENYVEQARALQKSGYATDPGYADKLIRIIQEQGFDQHDKKVGGNIVTKKHLIVAGHGGSDPGAIGNGTNERDFTRSQVVDRVAKFINNTPGHEAVVYNKQNNMYWNTQSGKGYGMYWAEEQGFDTVTEYHLDAASASARGGHVIVQGGLSPDKIDLGIRDALQKFVGIRYTHKGHSGISGRNDLLQVNVAAQIGVNYRLVELGFITNAADFKAIVNNIDALTRAMANAITGGTSTASNGTSASAPAAKPSNTSTSKLTGSTYTVKAGDTLSAIAKRANTTAKNLQSINGIQNANVIFPGQVIKLKGSKSPNATNTSTYTVKKGENLSTIAQRHNTTTAALQRLNNIQNANLIFPGQVLKLGTSVKAPSKKKSVDAVAREVIKGLWNNEPERSKRLRAAGYNADAVQKRVNQLL